MRPKGRFALEKGHLRVGKHREAHWFKVRIPCLARGRRGQELSDVPTAAWMQLGMADLAQSQWDDFGVGEYTTPQKGYILVVIGMFTGGAGGGASRRLWCFHLGFIVPGF